MKHSIKELIQFALDEGFTQAGELNTEALVFMPEVRDMCRADRCHSYGKSWRCPPACGSIEEASARAATYRYGIIMQTIGNMDDDFDFETIQETARKHGDSFRALMKKLKTEYNDLLPMGAGTCSRCEKCTYPDAPCRFPDDSYSPMEAYGLMVSDVCSKSGIPYNNGPHTITFTSCCLFK